MGGKKEEREVKCVWEGRRKGREEEGKEGKGRKEGKEEEGKESKEGRKACKIPVPFHFFFLTSVLLYLPCHFLLPSFSFPSFLPFLLPHSFISLPSLISSSPSFNSYPHFFLSHPTPPYPLPTPSYLPSFFSPPPTQPSFFSYPTPPYPLLTSSSTPTLLLPLLPPPPFLTPPCRRGRMVPTVAGNTWSVRYWLALY